MNHPRETANNNDNYRRAMTILDVYSMVLTEQKFIFRFDNINHCWEVINKSKCIGYINDNLGFFEAIALIIVPPTIFSLIGTKQFDVNSIVFTTWWRHQMETFSASLAICAGNSPVPGEFPAQRPVTRSFDVFFDLCLNKRLRK